ncbi:shikimate kinase [Candidatus Amarobacter glycogenicus]|uniref:shikimate kinase n=1 Tax=Candidatus Amarobacter glycogenicus TaxID=3140699 RepID=UPI0031376127|nr:shikimate kinase [Dehalococcoidia bacterium]
MAPRNYPRDAGLHHRNVGDGQSTVVRELAARGYNAVDLDSPDWSEYRDVDGAAEWVWREDRIAFLLDSTSRGDLFVSGCASNQGKFAACFDHVVLLSAPVAVILERLLSRTTNDFGKDPAERVRILDDITHVEPLLRRTATLELDAAAPLECVVSAIAALAG